MNDLEARVNAFKATLTEEQRIEMLAIVEEFRDRLEIFIEQKTREQQQAVRRAHVAPRPAPQKRSYDWIDHVSGISLMDKVLGH